MKLRIYREDRLIKVIMWRLLSILLGWILGYFYLDDAIKSLEMSVVIGAMMTAVHYVFEWQWEQLEKRDKKG